MKTKTLLSALSVLIGCTLRAEPSENARSCPTYRRCRGTGSLPRKEKR